MIRRVLLVHSGNSWSTHDVYVGLLAGFKSNGVEVIPYRLDHRLTAARDWVAFIQAREGAQGEEPEKGDVLYQAVKGAVIRAVETMPDAIVIVSGLLIEQRGYELLRRLGIPVLLFGTENPYEDEYYHGRAPYCDVFTVNDPVSLEPMRTEMARLRGVVTRVEHAPTGYIPEVHHPGVALEMEAGGVDVPSHDVVFVGTGFPERVRFLEAIDWTGIDFGLYGFWSGIEEDSALRAYQRGQEVENIVAAAMYDRARVTLNLFRTDVWRGDHVEQRATGTAVSPRIIEAAAIGACVVSEWRPEVEALFGGALPTFRTPAECEEIVRRLLADDEERAHIRATLPRLVAGYSYAERARELLGWLDEVRAAAPAVDMVPSTM